MSLEADLYAVLVTQCPRVFPDFAPLSTQRPYVTYQKIGGKALNFVDSASPSLRHTYLQLNVWADTRVAADALARDIEDALRAATAFTARPANEIAAVFEDDEPNLRGARQDFDIWSPR